MTESEEQHRIDEEVKKFKRRIWLLNRQNKLIKITGFKLQINHPGPTAHVPWWAKLFSRSKSNNQAHP